MASYEQAPNLQTYSFQPYNLPYNQIVKTVQDKTQYWIQGANQLKSASQQAAGLDLSLDQNRGALRDFTAKANEQVNAAAKTDLSQGDNLNEALHIFDPLYDGQSSLSQQIMGDHAITTRAKQIQSEFQASKTKNNGKEYSPINEQYALQSYYNFVKKDDPNGWKDAYDGLKGYTPYYDYHKEITDNIKNCKPSSVTQAGVNGMYITSTTTSGVTASQVSGCVGSNLSPQAENQMRMEGAIKYGYNYQALADDYIHIANDNKSYLNNERAKLAAQLAGKLSDPQKAQITSQMKDLDAQMGNIDDSIDKYHKGDLSFFRNNYETLAAATYRGQKLSSIGSAFAYTQSKQDIKADPVQMMIAKIHSEEGMLRQRENFDSSKILQQEHFKAELTAAEKGKKIHWNPDGSFTFEGGNSLSQNPTVYFPSVGPNGEQKSGIAEFNTALAANQQAQGDSKQWLYSYLKSNPKWADLVPNLQKDPIAFNSFAEGIFKGMDPNNIDIPLQQYLQKKQKLDWDHANLQATKQAVETSPSVVNAKGDIQTVLSGVHGGETVPLWSAHTGVNHLPLTEDMVKSLVSGDTKYGIAITKTADDSNPDIGSGQSSKYQLHTKDGNLFSVEKGSRLYNLLEQRDNKLNNYQSTLDDLYSQHNVSQRGWVSLASENDDLKDPNTLRGVIGHALAPVIGHGDNSVNAIKDVSLIGTDFAGNVRFTIKGDAKGNLPDSKQIIQQLAQNGLPNVQAVPNTTGTYEIAGVGNMGGINYNRPETQMIREVQTFAENLVNIHRAGGDKSPRISMPSYNGVNLAAVTGPSGEMYFELSDPNHPGVVQHATTPSDLIFYLNRLSR